MNGEKEGVLRLGVDQEERGGQLRGRALGSAVPHQEDESSHGKKPQSEEDRDQVVEQPQDTVNRVTLRSESGSSPLSKNELINHIWRDIYEAREDTVRVYEGVDVETAEAVIKHLEEGGRGGRVEGRTHRLCYDSLLKTIKLRLMPNKIHDSHQPWLVNGMSDMLLSGFLTRQEHHSLRVLSGTTFRSFGAPYASSRKESDQCVTPAGMDLPTLVIESGWSESRPLLHQDRDLWLRGGAGSVQVVLVMKWTKGASNRVRGDIEVFDLDPLGNVRSLQREIIFPAPIAATQRIAVTRRQLFGPALPQGQNPSATTHLELNALRQIANEYLAAEGYQPAT